jgi:phage terminase large subunit-like protein
MQRHFYDGVKLDLERIKTAMTVQEARNLADALLTKMKAKYDGTQGPIVRGLPNGRG